MGRELQGERIAQTVGEAEEQAVVGVNVHTEDEGPVRIGQPDYSALEAAQTARLGAHKAARDESDVKAHLESISGAARSSENLIPRFVEAVKAGVTLGEISDALRTEWGTYDG